MQKREAHDSHAAAESGSPATPRVSGEVLTSLESQHESPAPASSTRAAIAPSAPSEPGAPSELSAPSEPGVPSEPSDTLLSAGKPAHRLELLLEDRLAEVDQRLCELDGRLANLEQKKSIAAPEPRQQKPWLWVAFLIALAVVFQLLHRVR
jgi:hypothetical protein